MRLQGRAREIADSLRGDLGEVDAGSEVLLLALGTVLTRLEIAAEFIDEHGLVRPGKSAEPWPLLRLVSAWESQAVRLLDKLGMTPESRSKSQARASTASVLESYLASRGEG